jgi:hypothetical protein
MWLSTLLSTITSAFVPSARLPSAPKNALLRKRKYAETGSLYAAKSGGRMIETVEEFSEIVLAEDSPRPVLAFFSAAW